jgi:DNA invertase Pin-like site-specific DNA recombinase
MQTDSSLSRSARVALYARVSTLDKGQDPQMQLHELREYAVRRGWKISGEYTDSGVSGAKESRPELNRLMADAKQLKFDAVAVWKLDRFGRSLKHLVMTLADLESLGIAFVSLRDGFDLSTPSGRLMFQIIGAMGEFERNLIRDRVRAGMAHARAKGRKLGRARLCVDMNTVDARRANGESLRAIARDLGVSPALLVKRAKAVRSV